MNNGKIYKWIAGGTIIVIAGLVGVIYYAAIKTSDATALELKDHKTAQVASDLLTATTLASIDQRLKTLEKSADDIVEIRKILIRYGLK